MWSSLATCSYEEIMSRHEYFAVSSSRVLRFLEERDDSGELIDRGYATFSEHASPDEARQECGRLNHAQTSPVMPD